MIKYLLKFLRNNKEYYFRMDPTFPKNEIGFVKLDFKEINKAMKKAHKSAVKNLPKKSSILKKEKP